MIAWANDEAERLARESRIRMRDGQSQDLEHDGALMDGIPSGRLGPGMQVSGQAPRALLVALEISQVIVGSPAQQKAHLRLEQNGQPGKARISLSKNVQQEPSPCALSHTKAWCAPLPCPWWHSHREWSTIANWRAKELRSFRPASAPSNGNRAHRWADRWGD